MSNYAISLKRTSILLLAMAFTAMLMVVNVASFFSTANAAQLEERSLTLSSTLPGDETGDGTPGDETNGSDVVYTFTFDVPNVGGGNIGGVRFQFCTNAVGTCDPLSDAPESLDVTGAALVDEGALDDDFALDSAATNVIDIESPSPSAVAADTTVVVSFSGISNALVAGTFFVRITTYSNTAGGTAVDDGTVASAITEGIYITARVAETLGFSTTGDFDNVTGVVPETADCDPLLGSGAIYLGDPTEHTLSITQAYDNYTAFRVYTNAGTGVAIQYDGETLTRSGGPTIDPIAADFDSDVGAEQFGLGIDLTAGDDVDDLITVASRSADISVANVDPAADLGGGAGEISAAAGYNNADGTITEAGDAEFGFTADTPTTIASSTGYVICNTAAVRYLANIAPTTEAGTYTTTIVYIATPTY